MTKNRAKKFSVPYTAKVHRQHNSRVVTVPKGLCHALGIKSGDLVVFDLQCGKGYAEFSIVMKKDGSYGKHFNAGR